MHLFFFPTIGIPQTVANKQTMCLCFFIAESKQIEEKGGYAFVNHNVPQNFNFGVPPQ